MSCRNKKLFRVPARLGRPLRGIELAQGVNPVQAPPVELMRALDVRADFEHRESRNGQARSTNDVRADLEHRESPKSLARSTYDVHADLKNRESR
ncbi:hypothetical protein MAR_025286 [Mya arenaria]|uniref:Uncharacterized protein n=1 Tax=Mya arenaria TaxID=6604 RepID=A0ABY7DVJ2_MYAAR|nr:hypothetical protein MAR_025286 [Mya arenaria]